MFEEGKYCRCDNLTNRTSVQDSEYRYLLIIIVNIRDRQPMVRASVTERWAQLKSGNMILFTHDMYTNMIFLRNENIEYIQYSYKSF